MIDDQILFRSLYSLGPALLKVKGNCKIWSCASSLGVAINSKLNSEIFMSLKVAAELYDRKWKYPVGSANCERKWVVDVHHEMMDAVCQLYLCAYECCSEAMVMPVKTPPVFSLLSTHLKHWAKGKGRCVSSISSHLFSNSLPLSPSL